MTEKKSQLRELSLFSGAGGGLLATKHLLGWTTVGYVEISDYAQRVLAQRIREGYLDNAPIFTDIRAFIDSGCAELYRGLAEVITAGFPCQPFSLAGKTQAENDERDMWPATIECIRIIRPRYAFLENISALTTYKYFGRILGELADCGYCVQWKCISAGEVGSPHRRNRVWIVANSKCECNDKYVEKCGIQGVGNEEKKKWGLPWFELELDPGGVAPKKWWHKGYNFNSESFLLRDYDGLAPWMDRLKAIGNGQVPAVVKVAWEWLSAGSVPEKSAVDADEY